MKRYLEYIVNSKKLQDGYITEGRLSEEEIYERFLTRFLKNFRWDIEKIHISSYYFNKNKKCPVCVAEFKLPFDLNDESNDFIFSIDIDNEITENRYMKILYSKTIYGKRDMYIKDKDYSYFIEKITNEIERNIKEDINKIKLFEYIPPVVVKNNPELFQAKSWGLIGESIRKTEKQLLEDELFIAVRINSKVEAEYAIKKGANINYIFRGSEKWSILMYSVINLRYEITELLLEQPGININYKDNNDDSALSFAIFKNDIPLIKLLLQQPNIEVNNLDKIDKTVKKELIDYDFQKRILDNGREDIIITLKNNNLVHPKIKEENLDLFKAKDWGLI